MSLIHEDHRHLQKALHVIYIKSRKTSKFQILLILSNGINNYLCK